MNLIRKGDPEEYRQYTNRIDLEQLLSLPVDELWESISHSDKDIQHLFVKQMMELFPPETNQPEKLAFIGQLLQQMQDVLTGGPFEFKILANNVGEETNQM